MVHEIDYKIYGDDMQFVEIELDKDESVIAEAGAMMHMEDGIQLETIFGDGTSSGGGLMGKLFKAGSRLVTGESLFMTVFSNTVNYKRHVSFAAPYPGKIIPCDLAQHGRRIICQKDAFLCAAQGISIGIEFQKKLGVGFFGGEGFIMQRLTGDGLAFLHAGGTIVEKDLRPGEILRVDTGCLVAMTAEVNYEVEMVKGIKTALFGGEGLFFATVSGPGKVWLQSLPFSRFANRIIGAVRVPGKPGGKGEGSVLDVLGGLGNLLDGDR